VGKNIISNLDSSDVCVLINEMTYLYHFFVYLLGMLRLWNSAFMKIIKLDHKIHVMNHKFYFKMFVNARSKTTDSARTIFLRKCLLRNSEIKVPIVVGYCVAMHMLR
jgi:hypothetical protein